MSILSFIGQASDYYNYGPDYGYPNGGDTAASLPPAAFAVLIIFMLIFIAAAYVVHAYFLGRIFKKAGVESWKAWVPFYNNWVMLELGGQPGFWAVLAVIPFVNIASAVFMYIAMYHIGLRLGKEGVFVLLAIFLPIVWLIWLGVDHSTWDNNASAAAAPHPVTPTSSDNSENGSSTTSPSA